MCLKLQKLIDLYNQAKIKNSNLFIYEKVENIKYDFVNKEGLDVNIKLNKIEDLYMIFIFINRQGKLLFNGIVKESINNLIDDYYILLNDINLLSIEDLINKYYKDLNNNF